MTVAEILVPAPENGAEGDAEIGEQRVTIELITDIDHIAAHAGADEPPGTWTGLACPRHGRPLGSDVALDDVYAMLRQSGTLADYTWHASTELGQLVYRRMVDEAMTAGPGSDRLPHPPAWWQERIDVCWSRAWQANHTFLTVYVQAGGQQFVIASFEHNSSDHGLESPHVHNLVPVR